MSPDSAFQTIQADVSQVRTLMRLSFAALLGAIVLFAISLFLPVFITQSSDVYGYWVLAMGWLGFITFQFAWYATPFAVMAVYVSRKSPQFGLFLSVIAIVMASAAFLFTEIPFGKNDRVLDYGAGFYIWYLCFYLVSFSILLRLVAWGSMEEELEIEHDSSGIAIEADTKNNGLNQVVREPKARRKVIPVVTAVQNRGTKQRKWDKVLPPPLPKKNIYRRLPQSKERVGTTLPPPLLPFQLSSKKKQVKLPPPLPIERRKVQKRVQPPPLPSPPVRKKWSLKIAPFLDKS